MLDAAIRSLITRIKRCDVGKARWVLRRCLLLEGRFETVDATEQARITEALSASYTALKLAAAEKRDGKAIDEAFKVAASRIEECFPCQPQEELPDDQKRIQSLKAAMEHVTSKVPVNNIVKPLEVALTVVHSDPPKQDTLLYNLSENSGYDLQDIIFLARLKQPKMPERVPRFFQRELRRHRFTPEGSQFQRLKKLSHKIDTLPQAPTGGVGLHMVTTSPDFVLLVVGESDKTPDSFAVVNGALPKLSPEDNSVCLGFLKAGCFPLIEPQQPITNALPQHMDKRRVFRHYNGGWTYDYRPHTQASETWKDLKSAGRLKFNQSEWVVQVPK